MKVAIVTGVSRGLGAALAHALLDRAWNVIGVGRAAAAGLDGDPFRFVACDLADCKQLRSTVEPLIRDPVLTAASRLCLINNAAVAGPAGLIGMLDDDDVASSLAVNLLAPTLLSNL